MAILPITLCGANRQLSLFPEEETGSVRDSKCLGWHQGRQTLTLVSRRPVGHFREECEAGWSRGHGPGWEGEQPMGLEITGSAGGEGQWPLS